MEIVISNNAQQLPIEVDSYWVRIASLGLGHVNLQGTYQVFVEYRLPWIQSRYCENCVGYEVMHSLGIIVFYRRYRKGFIVACPYRYRNIDSLEFRRIDKEEEVLYYH